MRKGLRAAFCSPALVLTLCVFAAVAWSDDRAGGMTSEDIRAIFERQTTGTVVLPKALQDAFVAAEDRDFYTAQGQLSTISQHLAKRFIRPTRGMAAYKLSELSTTLAIENTLTRPEILAWYLQGIYLGRGCYGVDAAAPAYFGRAPAALALAESAMLAALASAPTSFDPSRRPEKAFERRNLVLAEMVKAGFVTEAAGATAARTPLDPIEPPGRCDP